MSTDHSLPVTPVQQDAQPAHRIKRKPPPPFQYSQRYPEPDPSDPFAPLSVLRSRPRTSSTSPPINHSPSYNSPLSIPADAQPGPSGGFRDLAAFVAGRKKKSAFDFPLGDAQWQGHTFQLRKGSSMGLHEYSSDQESSRGGMTAPVDHRRPGASGMQRHESRRRSQSVFALRPGTFSFIAAKSPTPSRHGSDTRQSSRSSSPALELPHPPYMASNYSSSASALSSSSSSESQRSAAPRPRAQSSHRPSRDSFASGYALDKASSMLGLHKSMHVMPVDMPPRPVSPVMQESPRNQRLSPRSPSPPPLARSQPPASASTEQPEGKGSEPSTIDQRRSGSKLTRRPARRASHIPTQSQPLAAAPAIHAPAPRPVSLPPSPILADMPMRPSSPPPVSRSSAIVRSSSPLPHAERPRSPSPVSQVANKDGLLAEGFILPPVSPPPVSQAASKPVSGLEDALPAPEAHLTDKRTPRETTTTVHDVPLAHPTEVAASPTTSAMAASGGLSALAPHFRFPKPKLSFPSSVESDVDSVSASSSTGEHGRGSRSRAVTQTGTKLKKKRKAEGTSRRASTVGLASITSAPVASGTSREVAVGHAKGVAPSQVPASAVSKRAESKSPEPTRQVEAAQLPQTSQVPQSAQAATSTRAVQALVKASRHAESNRPSAAPHRVDPIPAVESPPVHQLSEFARPAHHPVQSPEPAGPPKADLAMASLAAISDRKSSLPAIPNASRAENKAESAATVKRRSTAAVVSTEAKPSPVLPPSTSQRPPVQSQPDPVVTLARKAAIADAPSRRSSSTPLPPARPLPSPPSSISPARSPSPSIGSRANSPARSQNVHPGSSSLRQRGYGSAHTQVHVHVPSASSHHHPPPVTPRARSSPSPPPPALRHVPSHTHSHPEPHVQFHAPEQAYAPSHESHPVAGAPSPVQLAKAARLHVVKESGVRVPFGELWSGQRTVVVFVRHFWCPLCQDYMTSVTREVNQMALQRAGVNLIVIGCGSYGLIKSYRQIFHLPFQLYVDPSPGQELYHALGMGSASSAARQRSAKEEKGAYIRHGAVGGLAMVVRNALRVGMPVWERGGDVAQLGGEFVLGPGLTCSYAHRMQSPRSHAPISEVLAAAGVKALSTRRISRNISLPLERDDAAAPDADHGKGSMASRGRQDKVLSMVQEESAAASPGACLSCDGHEVVAGRHHHVGSVRSFSSVDWESNASGESGVIVSGRGRGFAR